MANIIKNDDELLRIMEQKVFKVLRRYQRSGKNVKFMATGRGSCVNRVELVLLFGTNKLMTAVCPADTKDLIDFIKPPSFHYYTQAPWHDALTM